MRIQNNGLGVQSTTIWIIPLEMVDIEAAAKKESQKRSKPLFDLLDCGEGMCGV